MGAELHGVQRTRIGAAVNAHSRNQYYAEDFERPPSQGLWIFCIVVLLVAALMCGFYAGMEFSNNLHKQAAAKQMLKPRPAPTKHDPLAKYCAAPRELIWACKQRRTAI
jgi:hypothetical protein